MITWELLRIQHKYSEFCTIREFERLGSSDDWEYCMDILSAIPDININKAKKEIADLMGWNEENGCFFEGNEWDYIMLDEILFKYVGRELYHD